MGLSLFVLFVTHKDFFFNVMDLVIA